jgi:hypothetical protein
MRTPIVITKADGTQKTIYAKNQKMALDFIYAIEQLAAMGPEIRAVHREIHNHLAENGHGLVPPVAAQSS